MAQNFRNEKGQNFRNRQDVLQLFAEGRSQKEIASLLHLSQKTVEFHKHHIMESFHLHSNADLVLFALKHGLISVDPEARPHMKTMR